ncbi:MAG TPA: hypothetical protein VMF30_18890, partial [Pirellulales bacterium]|nr:hypothetical protein [Pirellulales bacterium]
MPTTLSDAARTAGAPEDPDKLGAFICACGSQARQIVEPLGGTLPYPAEREHHTYTLYSRNGELKCETPAAAGETLGSPWLLRKKVWRISLGIMADQRPAEQRAAEFDDSIRSVSVVSGDGFKLDEGFYLLDSEGHWHRRTTEKAGLQLYAKHASGEKVRIILGNAAHAPWTRVMLPFQPEYPGGRRWNLGAPQLVYKPEPGSHPHWNLIFDHVGRELTEAL